MISLCETLFWLRNVQHEYYGLEEDTDQELYIEYMVIVIIIDALVCAGLAANIAEKKGYSSGAWGACGLFFGVLGLIAAAGLPKRDMRERSPKLTKVCPICAETIKLEAQVCKHCGQAFDEEDIISRLGDTLFDRSFETRHHAVTALLNIGTISALSTVLKRADYHDRLSAISVLAELQDGSAITALTHGLWDKSIRKEVSSTLVKIGSPALPILEKAIRSEGGELIRKYAERIIRDITGKT
jgi:HEAT repeat protein